MTSLGSSIRAAAGVGLGYVLDRTLGEPPRVVHPVVGFGWLMGRVEARWYRPAGAAGALFTAVGVIVAVAASAIVPSVPACCFVALGGRALEDAAAAVGDGLAAGDLDRCRSLLPSLVGRDVDGLDAADIARAVVESLAENTNDAVVAPLLYAATGRPGLVLVHRAVNTMDAMVGYRDDRYRRFGWASARLDDILGYLPARLTALAVVAVRPERARAVVRAVRRDAPAHPSPNGGVAEAAFAAALGVRLGGSNRYGGVTEHRATLGDGRPPAPADIAAALRLSRDVGRLVAALSALAAALSGGQRPRRAAGAARRVGGGGGG